LANELFTRGPLGHLSERHIEYTLTRERTAPAVASRPTAALQMPDSTTKNKGSMAIQGASQVR
jgi:hypothetical protein